jgi:hypothetical protein
MADGVGFCYFGCIMKPHVTGLVRTAPAAILDRHADERLDLDSLLGTGVHGRPGRVRLSVISTRSLGDAATVDFWVSQLLAAVSRWCVKSPQPRLQALLLFDERSLVVANCRMNRERNLIGSKHRG